MSKKDGISDNTLLEAVRQSLFRAGRYDPGAVVSPAVILWTDADGQWQPLVFQLRSFVPELLTLGDYSPEEKTGPAIWLRLAIEGMAPEIELPENTIPIIYMPNVSRQMLWSAEQCPDVLKPLVELQYRGTVWTQRNGKDWTIEAFLVSEDGLNLDMAKDKNTRQAMLRALYPLAITPTWRLREKRLEAEDFDKLMIADTPRDLLVWLNGPVHTRQVWGNEKWAAFCSRCKAEYGFHPDTDGELVAAEQLGLRETETWQNLWERYAEAPVIYPGIPNILRRAKPTKLIFNKETWPDENEAGENSLRQNLLDLEKVSSDSARQKIEELDKEHGVRREWVWARLGWSPMAESLKHLAILARTTETVPGCDSPAAMAKLYTENGYLADDAVLQAISSVRSPEDVRAVQSAIHSIYLPWLDDTARHFQELIISSPLPDHNTQALITVNPGQCLLFVDGFRFDLARRLVSMVEEGGLQVNLDWRWAGLPTVTATAKSAISPIAGRLFGDLPGEEFMPEIAESKVILNPDRFQKLLTEAGYQVFNSTGTGTPEETDARGWTEFGEFDRLGHTLQYKLAAGIAEQLEMMLNRIQELLGAGWKQVRLVTDHGWLLVPGGLPVIKLPKYLTVSRWARCASIKPEATVEVPTAGWFWNEYQQFAYAQGALSFIGGNEYAHGGVSLQECLIPDMTISLGEAILVSVIIKDVQWNNMRCRVVVEASSAGVIADLRTKPNNPNSSITTPKQIDSSGRVSLIVADDSLEGTPVSLVLLDQAGHLLAKRATTVGGDE